MSNSADFMADLAHQDWLSQKDILLSSDIYNGTPHAINVVTGSVFNPAIRKYTGGTVVLSIPSTGMLNAKVTTIDLPSIPVFGNSIPVFGKSFSGVDALPDGYDIYIVSAMYASAAARNGVDMSKVYTVADPVYTDDGNSFTGCRGICPAF
jgi:hypothetical protein